MRMGMDKQTETCTKIGARHICLRNVIPTAESPSTTTPRNTSGNVSTSMYSCVGVHVSVPRSTSTCTQIIDVCGSSIRHPPTGAVDDYLVTPKKIYLTSFGNIMGPVQEILVTCTHLRQLEEKESTLQGRHAW